jgi:hypothetical protein
MLPDDCGCMWGNRQTQNEAARGHRHAANMHTPPTVAGAAAGLRSWWWRF